MTLVMIEKIESCTEIKRSIQRINEMTGKKSESKPKNEDGDLLKEIEENKKLIKDLSRVNEELENSNKLLSEM